MEKSLTEKDSLLLIESMINKAKNSFSESGTLYLVWGFTVFICSIVQFTAAYYFKNEQGYYIWFLTWGVCIYQAFFLARKKRKEKVKTYSSEILGYVWMCFVICMALLIFLLIKNKAFLMISPAILILYAVPTFLSGAILKVRPLFLGGISCWVMAILTLFVPAQFHILLIAFAVLIAWIIPGLYMRRKFLSEKSESSFLQSNPA